MTQRSGSSFADGPTVQVEVRVAAAPEAIWPHLIALEAIVASSIELQESRWLDEPGPGARILGRNHRPDMGEWTTTSTVTEFDPARVFAWVVEDPQNPTASWRVTLDPDGNGALLTQRVRLGPGPSGLTRAIERWPEHEAAIVCRRLDDFETAMTATLTELGRRAAG